MFCFCYHNNIVGGKSQPVFAAEIAVFLGNSGIQRKRLETIGIRRNSAGNDGKWQSAGKRSGRQNDYGKCRHLHYSRQPQPCTAGSGRKSVRSCAHLHRSTVASAANFLKRGVRIHSGAFLFNRERSFLLNKKRTHRKS